MMKSFLHHALVISLLSAMLLSAISCSAGSNSSDTQPTSEVDSSSTADSSSEESAGESQSEEGEYSVSYPIQAEDTSLTFWLPIQPIASKYMSSYNEHLIYQVINENTGMNIEFLNCAPADGATQLSLLIAGGDIPDIMQIRGMYPGGAAAGVNDGVFADLTPYLEEHAPDYYKAIRTSDLCYRLVTDSDGRVFAFEELGQTAPAFDRMMYRQDMMDELSLDIPETLADYEEDFAIMQEAGISGLLLAKNGRTPILMWPFGITEDWCLDENGKVQYGQYTENYREYLTLMNDWYTKGYIYKDFMANLSDSEIHSLFVNGDVGMYPSSVDIASSLASANGFTAVSLPYVKAEEGQTLHFEKTYWESVPWDGFATTVISTSCDNIEAAVEYLNYYYTQEGADLCNWGIKDVHYTVDENGKKSFTDEVLNNPDMPLSDVQMNYKLHTTAKLAEPDIVCNPNVVANETALQLRMMYSDDETVDSSQTLPPFSLSAESSNRRIQLMNDITTYVDEMTLKFITGVTPLSEYDSYMEQLKAFGIEEAIAITQAEYDIFMNKPGL